MSAASTPIPIIKHKDQLYKYVNGGLLEGYTKHKFDAPEAYPFVRWHGNKLPHRMWQEILAFFAYTYDKGKDEALVYLYYNEEQGTWLTWAPPQRGMGMTVKTIDDHEGWKQAEEFDGYVRVGTGHHHCSTSAFQSGTDHADEVATGNGIHFTVGHMDKQWHDLHARVIFNGNMQETSMAGWVELADKYKRLELPHELLVTAYEYSLQSCAPKEMEFPSQWKNNFNPFGYQDRSSFQGNGHTGVGFSGAGSAVSYHNGKRGYWTTENGATIFKEFASQASATPTTHVIGAKSEVGSGVTILTPSLRAERELDKLLKNGMQITHLMMIQDALATTARGDWTGDKDTLAVIKILNDNGLNARWLEKYIEDEGTVRGLSDEIQSEFGGAS